MDQNYSEGHEDEPPDFPARKDSSPQILGHFRICLSFRSAPLPTKRANSSWSSSQPVNNYRIYNHHGATLMGHICSQNTCGIDQGIGGALQLKPSICPNLFPSFPWTLILYQYPTHQAILPSVLIHDI